MQSKLSWFWSEPLVTFRLPLFILFSIAISLVSTYTLQLPMVGNMILLVAVMLGSVDLIGDTIQSLLKKKFALDYIALLAISVSLVTANFVVAAIIVLMLTGGATLEDYGMARARKSLSALIDRIPDEASVWVNGHIDRRVPVVEVQVGQLIAVRRGEVVPLDGVLVSHGATTDESSLTGEPYFIDKLAGDVMRSGTVNEGDVAVLRVTKPSGDSTYAKIISMVEDAQAHKAPFIRLADRYSAIFTLVTLFIATVTFFFTRDLTSVLSVLVIATPCPLILATPIALIGGINAAAKRRIIIKDISNVEVMSRVSVMVFDKTGTITLGKPTVTSIDRIDTSYTMERIIQIADALERNSLHPLAKAVVEEAKKYSFTRLAATDVTEVVGKGISGHVVHETYTMAKAKTDRGMAIELSSGKKRIAVIYFEDRVKKHTTTIMKRLIARGLSLYLFTGDKKNTTEKLATSLHVPVTVFAHMTPEEKMHGIQKLKGMGNVTAMVGDGINDAPALARSDVGMVFANEEHTAASEAADVVFFGGDIADVAWVLSMSRRTIQIALQSIVAGIGISTVGMIIAAFGYIPPTIGAALQEGIDILVIFNALRTSRA